MDKGSSEIQQVIHMHRFTDRVSAHFYIHLYRKIASFVITLQYNFEFLSGLLSYTHYFFMGEGLIYEKCIKAVSFHYFVIKYNF